MQSFPARLIYKSVSITYLITDDVACIRSSFSDIFVEMKSQHMKYVACFESSFGFHQCVSSQYALEKITFNHEFDYD